MRSSAPKRLLLVLTIGICSMGALAAAAPRQPRIVNGLNTHDFATTGALMYNSLGGDINEHNAGSWCSGTLIGCETFLTAAHCVEDDSSPSHYWVFLQHAGVEAVTSITAHPSYTGEGFPEFDVAVLKLGSPVTGIDPTEINTSTSPAIGSDGMIAGFGQTDGGAGDYGIKRFGRVVTSNCTGVVDGNLGNTELVCWQFADPVGAPGDDSNTCNGDSGGPLLIDIGGNEVVAGVTSGGNSGNCLPTDDSYDANVFTYSGFILGELGTDSTSACGGLPVVGDPTTVQVIGNAGTLGSGNTSDTITFPVTGAPTELRVTLNGENNGSLAVDFYVKEGLGAGPSSHDCKADGGANLGTCIFTTPNSGQWSIFVNRTSGFGEYQVTATTFGGDPPECGNAIRESGEECDGNDDAACSGLCQAGCTCPPPVCGNNIMESGEECDGTDDAACPGSCDQLCACAVTNCNTGDLFVLRGRSNERSFRWKAEIYNFAGTYDGLDPRNQFLFTVTQGANSVAVEIPPGDLGWARSRPERGRFRWKGLLNGIKSVKVVDRSLRRGIWIVKVRGRKVPGAGLIDVVTEFADVQITMDEVCTEGEY